MREERDRKRAEEGTRRRERAERAKRKAEGGSKFKVES